MGSRLCLGFGKIIESFVVYRFDVMQGVVVSSSTHFGGSLKH